MSRFAGAFGGGDSSSSDDERSQSEEEQKLEVVPENKKVSKYMMGSDDEDDEERHFLTGKDKKWESLEKVLEECRKHANISDFNNMDSSFAKLETEIGKVASVLFKEQGDQLPNRVLKVLLTFEDAINEVTNAMKKKMSKGNATAHNKLKQRFRKYMQGTGEAEWLYETQLAKYREDPQDSVDEDDEEQAQELAPYLCTQHSQRIKHFYCSEHPSIFCRECIKDLHNTEACFVVDLYEIEKMRKLQEQNNEMNRKQLKARQDGASDAYVDH